MKKVYRKIRFILSIIFIIFSLILLSYLTFISFYRGRFFPGVKISGLDVGGQNTSVVQYNLNSEFEKRSKEILYFQFSNQHFNINLSASSPETNLDETIIKASAAGRSGNVLEDLKDQLRFLVVGQDFISEIKFKNKSQLLSQITTINQQVKKDAVPAQLIFNDTVNVVPSQDGIELDNNRFLISLQNYISLKSAAPSEIPTKPLLPNLTTAKAEKYKKVLDQIKSSPIKLVFEDNSWTIDQATLYSLLDFDKTKPEILSYETDNQIFSIEGITTGEVNLSDNQLLLDKDLLNSYLNSIAKKINQPLKEAKFIFEETSGRVTEFEPGQTGRELNITKTSILISKAIAGSISTDITLPVEQTFPKSSASEINNYGIKELLGTGTSSFIDSIPNRVFNIRLSASRVNGILVPPGEVFSFNQYIGEVTAATGFKQAYVIKDGKTILDDGGGVCQVSTTLFRAVLNAGLPIVERTAHAYRVGFYEQGGFPPGIDATVYPPSVDFKFKNDTGSYILIQSYLAGYTLTYKIYGTSDGRITTIEKPIILSRTAPPPELRKDDPALPRGTEQETEHAIWGMNTQFRRFVIRNNETIVDEIIRSNFRPWQKVTLVGTKE